MSKTALAPLTQETLNLVSPILEDRLYALEEAIQANPEHEGFPNWQAQHDAIKITQAHLQVMLLKGGSDAR